MCLAVPDLVTYPPPACYALEGCVWGGKNTNAGSPTKSWYHHLFNPGVVPYYIFILFFCVYGTWRRITQAAATVVVETTATSRNESVISPRKKESLVEKTYKMKKAWASDELLRLFVTSPTDHVGNPSRFCCQICQRDVSVLTHGSFGILWHYQGAYYCAMDQCLVLETPGCRVLDFSGKTLLDEKVEPQRARILLTPVVWRDREYPFCEDLITDDAGVADPQLSILAKVSSLLDVLRLGRSYELVEQLWAHFSLTTSCVNIETC